MNRTSIRVISRVLIAAMFSLSLESAHAGLIGVDQLPADPVTNDRAALIGFVTRADVARELERHGIDPQLARERITSLTDDEVRSLTSGIDSQPAGGFISSGAVAGGALAFGLLVVLIIKILKSLFSEPEGPAA